MAITENPVVCPAVDLLTNEEIHRALLRAVLVRQKVSDPEAFVRDYSVESQVMFREVRMPDGSNAMMASVAISKITQLKFDTVDPQQKG